VVQTPKSNKKPSPRPLLVRPGARFACAGDGLCCTDIHALGPISHSEARDMRKLRPGSVIYHEDVEALCMRPGAGGGCAQLERGMCGIHARFGPEQKPVGCRRFPYGLVSTPFGGRVTTEHRCPCRTLGARPPLDVRDAEVALRDQAGRLEVDVDAPRRVALTVDKRVGFARYAELEAGMLERLERGERAETVLGAKALPDLHERSWPLFAAELLSLDDGTRGGVAVSWFGDGLLAASSGHKPPARTRPWREAFERGARRGKVAESRERVFNDWVADELWMMRWLPWGCAFDVARAELATRLHVARWIARRIEKRGAREDQAAAEAVMAAELTACSEPWGEAVDAIANDPSPARDLLGE
jgi:hypothetical protein